MLNRSSGRLLALTLLWCVGCRSDLPSTPGVLPSRILVVTGDGQRAAPDDMLDDPVELQVLDAEGQPLAGVAVHVAVPIGGGTVPESDLVSDSLGRVTTSWTMGESNGQQMLEVLANNVVMATVNASACDPFVCFAPEHLSSTLSDATLLSLATYESSGQTVHPDVIRGHGAAAGWWLAITPYPNGNSAMENPSIYRSKDLVHWSEPNGVLNPVERPVEGGYFSDPDMVSGPNRHLWMFYREVNQGENIIDVVRSSDGVVWDAPTAVIRVPSHEIVSPTVVRGAPGAPWQMWSVNSGPMGCTAAQTTVERRTSADGLAWSDPATVGLVQPGRTIWHIDVEWVPSRSEYWAVYNTYAIGTSCATDALYLARSSDGAHWTVYPSPIARAGMIAAFRHLVYRSSFVTDPKGTRITLWISGAAFTLNAGYTWQTATVSTTMDDLLALASTPSSTLRADPARSFLPPPEPDLP